MNTQISKNEELNEYAQLLLNNGFTIIAYKEPEVWIHFEKDNKFGYAQYDRFRGITFSTVHKPCKECGTGFGMEDDRDRELMPLNVESALKTINTLAPDWATDAQRKAIVKYKDIADFTNDFFRKDSRIFEPINQTANA